MSSAREEIVLGRSLGVPMGSTEDHGFGEMNTSMAWLSEGFVGKAGALWAIRHHRETVLPTQFFLHMTSERYGGGSELA